MKMATFSKIVVVPQPQQYRNGLSGRPINARFVSVCATLMCLELITLPLP